MQFNLEITGRDRRAQPKLSKPFYYLFVYDFFYLIPLCFTLCFMVSFWDVLFLHIFVTLKGFCWPRKTAAVCVLPDGCTSTYVK